jgi:hypothetical protein
MSVFANVDSAAPTQADKDVVRGQKREPIASSIQNMIIEHAYFEKKKSGASFVNVQLKIADGEHKDRFIRLSECVASGDAKGNKTYYEKAGERINLPGFALIDSLAQLVAGKSVITLANAKKTIKLYNFDKKEEVPTEVDMFTELTGKGICGCVLSVIEDKTVHNAQTGAYDPTGQVYRNNTIDKFLDPQKRRTYAEINNNLDPTFKDQWLAKWEDQVSDKSTEVKSAGLKGAPAAAGGAAEKTDLFG